MGPHCWPDPPCQVALGPVSASVIETSTPTVQQALLQQPAPEAVSTTAMPIFQICTLKDRGHMTWQGKFLGDF